MKTLAVHSQFEWFQWNSRKLTFASNSFGIHLSVNYGCKVTQFCVHIDGVRRKYCGLKWKINSCTVAFWMLILSPIIIIIIIIFIAVGFAQSNCHLHVCMPIWILWNRSSIVIDLWYRNVFSVHAFIGLVIFKNQIFYRFIHHRHECIHFLGISLELATDGVHMLNPFRVEHCLQWK